MKRVDHRQGLRDISGSFSGYWAFNPEIVSRFGFDPLAPARFFLAQQQAIIRELVHVRDEATRLLTALEAPDA
jgi:hypothetical protein